jgi:glutamate-ammonia-ligase adenylyltransferase
MAAGHALVAPELARACQDAYREFRRLQHALRLNGARFARVPPQRVAAQVRAVRALWARVLG